MEKSGQRDTAIRQALAQVIDPVTGRNVVEAGLISGLVVREDRVGFLIAAAAENAASREGVAEACRQAVLALPGITSVSAVLSADVPNAAPSPHTPHPEPVEGGLHASAEPAALLRQTQDEDGGKQDVPIPSPKAKAVWNAAPITGVTRLLAVASGKGGVGKSTVAVGLAHAFRQAGWRVGLLDADIYGPSLPRMMGLGDKPEALGGKLVPPLAHGIACLSMGLLIAEGEAAVLRGPMVGKTLQQFLRGADWGELDLLILDLPPGTGDVQLSLAQNVPLGANGGGAILVTTPQAVAVADARKAASMFAKVGVPILGIVENMSWLETPDGGQTALFGAGGGQALAEETGAPLLAQLPLDPRIGQALDHGKIPPLTGYEEISAYLVKIWETRATLAHRP